VAGAAGWAAAGAAGAVCAKEGIAAAARREAAVRIDVSFILCVLYRVVYVAFDPQHRVADDLNLALPITKRYCALGARPGFKPLRIRVGVLCPMTNIHLLKLKFMMIYPYK
jgi:hypothetical protein